MNLASMLLLISESSQTCVLILIKFPNFIPLLKMWLLMSYFVSGTRSMVKSVKSVSCTSLLSVFCLNNNNHVFSLLHRRLVLESFMNFSLTLIIIITSYPGALVAPLPAPVLVLAPSPPPSDTRAMTDIKERPTRERLISKRCRRAGPRITDDSNSQNMDVC